MENIPTTSPNQPVDLNRKKRTWSLVFAGILSIGVAVQSLLDTKKYGAGLQTLALPLVALFAGAIGYLGSYAIFWRAKTEREFRRALIFILAVGLVIVVL